MTMRRARKKTVARTARRARPTDNLIKFLAERDPAATVAWLLRQSVQNVAPLMGELPKHPMRPDFLFTFDPAPETAPHKWSLEIHAVHFEWQDSATTHLPLKDVPRALTREDLIKTLRVLREGLKQRFGLAEPHVLVLGLNPHAGEGGHLGREELDVIGPASAVW